MQEVNHDIPDNDTKGLLSTITINDHIQIEFIDIYFDAPNHTRLGDLEITLTSPQGTVSILATRHSELFSGAFQYANWRFGTIRCLGESSKGVWCLTVKDKQQEAKGELNSWKIVVYGHLHCEAMFC